MAQVEGTISPKWRKTPSTSAQRMSTLASQDRSRPQNPSSGIAPKAGVWWASMGGAFGAIPATTPLRSSADAARDGATRYFAASTTFAAADSLATYWSRPQVSDSAVGGETAEMSGMPVIEATAPVFTAGIVFA